MLPYRIILAVYLTLVLLSEDVQVQGRDEFTHQREFYRTKSQLTQALTPSSARSNTTPTSMDTLDDEYIPIDPWSQRGECFTPLTAYLGPVVVTPEPPNTTDTAPTPSSAENKTTPQSDLLDDFLCSRSLIPIGSNGASSSGYNGLSSPGRYVDPMTLSCDIKLCWLKLEEEAGTIQWGMPPNCSNGVVWSTFNCKEPVPCTDPGESEFSQRTWSGSPFTTGSTITYTCDSCSQGGGTITCQSNGQYDKPKPRCEKLACPRPQIENGRLIPNSDEYQCGDEVVYACHEGFTLKGELIRKCLPSGQFDGNATCIRIACPRPQIENGQLTPNSDRYLSGAEVVSACHEGFTLIGEFIRKCLPSGQFSGNAICVRIEGENVTRDIYHYID